jgi:hypothetical protein
MAEPLRATFYTLRKHGPRNGVIMGATLTTGVLLLALIGGFMALVFSAFAPLYGQGATADGGQVFGAVLSMIGLAFVLIFAIYLLFASYEAALLRWMIRGEAPGWFGMSLGVDTWRVYAGYWMWFVISLAVSLGVSAVITPFIVFSGFATSPSATAPDIGAILIMQLLINGLYFAVMAFIGIRFAPAAATSIARRRFSFFDAWKVTKGRFWALFGSFFILMIGYLVVLGVFFGFLFGSVFRTGFSGVNAAPQDALGAFTSVFTPQNLIIIGGLYLLMFLAGIVYVVFSFGVNARAVIAAVDEGKIDGQTPNVAKVFE